MPDLLTHPITITKPRDLPPLAIGLRDAARMMGVSERHLQKLAIAGQVPSAMVGCRRVFRIASLEAWLTAQESRQAGGAE